jgi:hypothetical protein
MSKILDDFRAGVRVWRKHHQGHAYNERQIAYMRLFVKYGLDRVRRHQPRIKAVLDRAEAELS